MRIVDFHNHYYPPEYLDALRTARAAVKVTYDDEGNPLRALSRATTTSSSAAIATSTIARRSSIEHGVDTQVVTLHDAGRPRGAAGDERRARAAWSTTRSPRGRENAGRFTALATLPLNEPAASVVELERAMKDLGFRGAMVFSNVNDVAPQTIRFCAAYEKANELGRRALHPPTHPLGVESMLDYWLMPLVGFLMDTTLAASKIVFSGVVERHPRIRWVLCHTGGTIPYLAERLDRGYHAFADCRRTSAGRRASTEGVLLRHRQLQSARR